MSKYHTTKAYGDAIGPLGFAMPSRAAKAVEAALRDQPRELRDRFKATVDGQQVDGFARKVLVPKGMDLVDGERADISIITADGVDHDGEVVLPGGGVFDTFRANPVIAWCHDYKSVPVGRAEWIAPTSVGDGGKGLKAKSLYTSRPKDFAGTWFPDTVWGFVQAGDLKGKSIGFVPLSMRAPTSDELRRRPDWKGADLIDRWLMLEYSVCPIPCQPQSLVESVAKMRTKGLSVPQEFLTAHKIVLPTPTPSVAEVEATAGTTAAVAFKSLTPPDEAPEPLLTQYIQNGGSFSPVGDVSLGDALPKHAYRVSVDGWTGEVKFDAFAPKTDELLRFKSSVAEDVLTEIDRFWGLKPDYDRLGLLHNRGMVLYGPPGTGKTSVLHQVAEMVVRRGDVVLYGKSISAVAAGLAAFREVEPDRKAVVVLEDADEYVGWQERDFLQLLDGEKSVDGVLYLATTNYIDAFPPRLLRPGRFDRKVYVGPPAYDARLAYLTAKVVDTKSGTEAEVQRLAAETDGLSFGDLRELVAAVYALKEPADDVIARLRGECDSRVKSWRGKSAELRKKDLDEAALDEAEDAACEKCGGELADGKCSKCDGAAKAAEPAPSPAPAAAAAISTPSPTVTPPPATAKAFVADATIANLAETMLMKRLSDVPDRVAAGIMDAVHRRLGTP